MSTLQPGVSPMAALPGPLVDQSSFSLDGGNNTNDMDGSMSVYTASFAGDPTGGVANQNTRVPGRAADGRVAHSAGQRRRIQSNTAGQTADFNSSSGAEVKVVTKRGTNAWHGTGYEYYLDNNWSSNSWQNNSQRHFGSDFPAFITAVSAGRSAARLFRRKFWVGRPISFSTTKDFNLAQLRNHLPKRSVAGVATGAVDR